MGAQWTISPVSHRDAIWMISYAILESASHILQHYVWYKNFDFLFKTIHI